MLGDAKMVDEVLDPLFGNDDAAKELEKEQARLEAEQQELEAEQQRKEELLEQEQIRGLQGARRSPGGSSASLG